MAFHQRRPQPTERWLACRIGHHHKGRGCLAACRAGCCPRRAGYTAPAGDQRSTRQRLRKAERVATSMAHRSRAIAREAAAFDTPRRRGGFTYCLAASFVDPLAGAAFVDPLAGAARRPLRGSATEWAPTPVLSARETLPRTPKIAFHTSLER